MSKPKSLIAMPELNPKIQLGLFSGAEVNTVSSYPTVLRDPAKLNQVLQSCDGPGIGLDLEFTNDRPSIFGVSSSTLSLSTRWSPELAQQTVEYARSHGKLLLGYSSISADKKIMDSASVPTPLALWDDGMIVHYLANQNLCKSSSGDEDDDPGALGFMNLWTATSLVTDVPNWKTCRGPFCSGPCPTHDVFGYNGLDAWAGLVVWEKNSAELDRMKVPQSFRREMLELTELCEQMREQGVAVDLSIVRGLEEQISHQSELLFPENGGRFNPNSSLQVKEWFSERGLRLPNAQKATLRDEMLKAARKRSIIGRPEEVAERFGDESLDEVERCLVDLWQVKNTGKGLGAWFGEKHLKGSSGPAGSLCLLHPRFITTGTSLGRLSSSGPNMQNMKKYGLGKKSRGAIVPRDPSLRFLRFDYKQLELRMCLYLAGYAIKDIPKDTFTWLLQNSGGRFAKAAALAGKSERDMAKITSHGSDYLMGLKVLTGADMETPYIKSAIAAGALRVHKDWNYGNGVVAFTGKHLAELLFGDATFESRKKALEIQEDVYFAAFPQIRAWQRKILAEFEARQYVRYPTGRFLRLIGPYREEDSVSGAMSDDAKIVAAAYGQGVSADHVQAVMLKYKRQGVIPVLQVHDELVIEVPRSWSESRCAELAAVAQEETWRLPGFSCPVDAGLGDNWLDAMNAADKTPLKI